jgi:[ribosomal protein S5]-alanine N-acetyltransferase
MTLLSIETNRLMLIAGTVEITEAAIKEDTKVFSELLLADVPESWPHELLKDAEPFFAEVLKKDPSSSGWWIWYILLKNSNERQNPILIGNTGFKGPPNENGMVELGYAILDGFQGLGYGTEAVSALIDWAFLNPKVQSISAETYPDLVPSMRVMEKCGMRLIGNGSEEGTIRYCKQRA